MKGLFKKPEWASQNTNPDFYRRSGQTYSDIIAANEAAHRKTKSSPDASDEATTGEVRYSKRCRTSEEPEEEVGVKESVQAPAHPESREQETPPSPQHQHKEPENPAVKENKSPKITQPARSGQPSLNSDPHPDELQNRQSPVVGQPVQNAPDHPIDLDPIDLDHQEAEETSNAQRSPDTAEDRQSSALPTARTRTSPVDDPVVRILITSEIPNSNSLIVHRKMSQGLRDVRLEWCRRQDIPTEAQSSVYFTWRGRRLFDVTTCKSLGVKAKKSSTSSTHGILGIGDDTVSENGEQELLQIHVVATSDNTDLLRRPGPTTSAGPGAGNTNTSTNNPSEASPNPGEDQQNQNHLLKLILRSPDLDDLKIKARPKTLVSKLISAFREKHMIASDQDLLIHFDGDRLDPDTSLQEHDIDDLDMLEIQVKPRP
ncbi:hypothetical protein N7481_011229 [Penicillium waksmanii]|uniref:uncharacterized protein n=1 Tax=Penicillium waksmanii TaxID=69791 RepID=UPI002547906A|nr:uncharacterized protein N7481_011229 [Penicillium waksmanii]KAJ5974019.1 hypothetical protein N7481_011229 [Penicillium waksmanii]